MDDIRDATVEFRCPVEGCTYKAPFRIAGGSETDSDAHAERERILRDEHPRHPRGERKPKFTTGYLFKLGQRAAVTGESTPTDAAPGIQLLISAEAERPHARVAAQSVSAPATTPAVLRVVRVLGGVVRVVRFAAKLVTGRIRQAADKIRRESHQQHAESQADQASGPKGRRQVRERVPENVPSSNIRLHSRICAGGVMRGPSRSVLLTAQAVVMRVVFSLPERARRLIAGRPVRVDGRELALDAQLLLRLRHLSGAAGLAADTPGRSRALMSESTSLIEGRRIEPVRTRDLMIPGGDEPIRARLYVPDGLPDGSPLLLFFHGGGFVIGDLDTHDNLCRLLAKHSDVRVLSVDYRLAPENPFPAAVNDGIAAYRYCVENAVQLGVNPAAIALGGDSAGGNVAAVTAHSAARHGESRPAFLLLFYPAVDASVRRRSRELFGTGFLLTDADMDWFMDHYCPDEAQRTDPRLSLHLAEDLGILPPTYLAICGFDPLRDEDMAFAERLAAEGVPVVVRRYDDLIHGYATMLGVSRRFREAVFEAVGALRTGLALHRLDTEDSVAHSSAVSESAPRQQ